MKKIIIKRLIDLVIIILILSTIPIYSQKDRTFDKLAFQGANIRAVFQFLAETGNINIVVDPSVSGNITLELKSIGWQKVMDILLETFDLTAVQNENYLRILKTADYQTELLSKKEFEEKQQQLIDPETRIVKIDNATAADIAPSVRPVLSDRGQVTIDARSNSLIIKELPEFFPDVIQFIRSLDKETGQLRISGKYMLIDSDFMDALGVRWKTQLVEEEMDLVNVEKNPETDIATEQRLEAYSETDMVATQLGQFRWGIISGDFNIEAQISAMTSTGKGRIIDHPEIVTLDNMQAEIYSGEQVPIFTMTEAGNATASFYSTGTKLTVTPHITSEDRILMKLDCERSAFSPSAAGGVSFTIITKNASTSVLVSDGETVVIGGLTTQDTKTSHSGVPFFKDLPLIGKLFQYNQERTTSSDLVFFITPEILSKESE
ncbi:type IV pilus secretin PilQ [bacterium]|nr:type IV pilus secretin PilQ [bacterium]